MIGSRSTLTMKASHSLAQEFPRRVTHTVLPLRTISSHSWNCLSRRVVRVSFFFPKTLKPRDLKETRRKRRESEDDDEERREGGMRDGEEMGVSEEGKKKGNEEEEMGRFRDE